MASFDVKHLFSPSRVYSDFSTMISGFSGLRFGFFGGLRVLLLDRSHEELQNVNFEQNHSVATVNSLMHTLVMQLDVKSVEKESVFLFHFLVCWLVAANFDLV